ncbi:MAG: FAD:protein FMN transferase [Bacillota bacterium]
MNRKSRLTIVITLVLVLAGAIGFYAMSRRGRLTKYTDTFFDTFDTAVTVVAYTKTESEFDAFFDQIHARFQELHKLYDIYNSYEGVSNVRTINLNAGVAPVKVPKELIDLIDFSKEWYRKTNGQTNIAMGAVLQIWHEYREAGIADPESAQLPPMEALLEAAKHIDIDKVIVDRAASTVYLEDPRMSLDLGAVAKGYATELVAKEAQDAGLVSAVISSGGNVRAIGKPLDGVRERWGIGIQDPSKSILTEEENLLDVVFINDASVVSSGDYQRYYVVDGKRIHHLIDPETLMPGEHFRAVTVVTPDSGIADFMSTTLFLMPLEEGKALAKEVGVDAVWVLPDGTVEMTEGFASIAKSRGATGAKAQ